MTVQGQTKYADVTATDVSLPDDIDTAQSKLCYLALDVSGAATLEELDAVLDLGKLTLLDVLRTLDDEGYLQRTADGRYATQ